MFKITMGKPGMKDSWDELKKRVRDGLATKVKLSGMESLEEVEDAIRKTKDK